ncbi:17065_t:CDS:2, partial [Acaulospora colombiana]
GSAFFDDQVKYVHDGFSGSAIVKGANPEPDPNVPDRSWCLFALSQHPDVQSRLRQELLEAFPVDNTPEVTVEALNALPYFEAVVRETLRFYPPVEFTARVAEHDDVIPVAKPFEGADGVMRDHIQ